MQEHFLIDWLYLVPAVFLLLFPRPWMKAGRWLQNHRKPRETLEKFAEQGGQDPEDKSVNLGRELANKRNYLDFFRALIGGYALWHCSFEASGETSEMIGLGLGATVGLAGLLLQSVRWGKKVNFYAPLFYIAGFCISHGNPYDGLFALLLTLACNPAIPNPRIFLTCFALLLLSFGWLFDSDIAIMATNTVFSSVVPVFSLLAGRPLVVFFKKAK